MANIAGQIANASKPADFVQIGGSNQWELHTIGGQAWVTMKGNGRGLLGAHVDQGEWRSLLGTFHRAEHLNRYPRAGESILDVCVPLEWCVYRSVVTHAALFLAHIAYPAEGNKGPREPLTTS